MSDSRLVQYENLWRPDFEFNQAIGWLVGAIAISYLGFISPLPAYIEGATIVGMLVMCGYRFRYALVNWERKESLQHTPILWMTSDEVSTFARTYGHEKVLLGSGFEWKTIHAQRAFQLIQKDISTIKANYLYSLYVDFLYKKSGVKRNKTGSPWIHGLETENRDITPKKKNHTIVFGFTGAGKTRLAELSITQAIYAGRPVIVVDPKGDSGLRDRMLFECQRAGRERDFAYFSPAHAEESVLIDPMKNWSRVTQIASRISALLTGEAKMDAWSAFAWRALYLISEGLIITEDRPNLIKLRRYIEGGADKLVERVIERYLISKGITDIDDRIKPFIARVQKNPREKPQSTTPDRAHAMVLYYMEKMSEDMHNAVIDGLVNMYQHSREHFQKMITNLIPTLNMLTGGELCDLLSPDYKNTNEKREILDSAKIISMNKVVLIGLDSLSDGTVGSAIGSVLLADLTSVAGDIYNHTPPENRKLLDVYIDEAAEVVNEPTVQLLNKSRGSGFSITLFAQILPDFIKRIGNEEGARQVLGNCGNIIAFRTTDPQTQEFIVGSFGKTMVKDQMHSMSITPIVNKDLTDWAGGTGERLVNTEEDLFRPALLARLPDLHFVSFTDGGLIEKGILPLMHIDQNWQFSDHWPRWRHTRD